MNRVKNRGISAVRLLGMGAREPRTYQSILQTKRAGLTYLTMSALFDLHTAARGLEKERVPGVFIEMGVALGGSAIVIAKAKEPARPLHLYDTFAMIPPPSANDGPDAHRRYSEIESGKSSGLSGDVYYGYQENLIEKVKNNFRTQAVEPGSENIEFFRGLYEDTLNVTGPVALAHIDCDWYDSVMICLERIVPHLVRGGRLVIDDYHVYSGSRRAIDEYFEGQSSEFDFVMKSRLHIIRR